MSGSHCRCCRSHRIRRRRAGRNCRMPASSHRHRIATGRRRHRTRGCRSVATASRWSHGTHGRSRIRTTGSSSMTRSTSDLSGHHHLRISLSTRVGSRRGVRLARSRPTTATAQCADTGQCDGSENNWKTAACNVTTQQHIHSNDHDHIPRWTKITGPARSAGQTVSSVLRLVIGVAEFRTVFADRSRRPAKGSLRPE